MAENSKIEWTDNTFNPWIGCTKVSPGCVNCYAETLMDTRYNQVKWGKGQPRKRTSVSNWNKPKQWNKSANEKRPKVFCASLADWLDEEVPIEWVVDLLQLIIETPNLDWLLLTKRPQNFFPRLNEAKEWAKENDRWQVAEELFYWLGSNIASGTAFRPPANVWIGTTAEDQQRWDERMPKLFNIPATVRFVSAEPLLGPIDIGTYYPDWLIVGGESGPNARTMDVKWVRSLMRQCNYDATAFFFKQWGGLKPKENGRELDGVTYSYFPENTKVVDSENPNKRTL